MYRRITIVLVALLVFGWPSAPSSAPGQAPRLWAVSGDIVSADGARHGWVVFDHETGDILSISSKASDVPRSARRIKHDGYIFPGLIDTHNHPHYNFVPRWRPGRFFENRYEWQLSQDYDQAVKMPYRGVIDAGLWDEGEKYGEVRAMIGGTTMLQGIEDVAPGYLVRNLSPWEWGVWSDARDVATLTPDDVGEFVYYSEEGFPVRMFLHVAEGKQSDERSRAEFTYLRDELGLAVPGVVVIHGVALTDDDFQLMHDRNMALVWSPRSNLLLYGETTDVVAALNAGVTVALGPDWTITGSNNLLEELKFAYQYSIQNLHGAITPRQLFKMVTSDAARVAGVNEDNPYVEWLGTLKTGYQADLFLAPRLSRDPFLSLLKTNPWDIDMVVIDGKPVYGQRSLMKDLVAPEQLDCVVVHHKKQAVDLIEPDFGPYGEERYDELVALLEGAIGTIAPLIEGDAKGHHRFPVGIGASGSGLPLFFAAQPAR